MNQQFSVLGLFFSILILAENTITVLNNVLQSKPMNMENNHSTIKINTTFLNKKFINFDRTRNLNVLNFSRLNNNIPVTSFVNWSQINRFPRQVSNKNNNEDTEYKRYIKVILDLRPDNYEDMYDYYNNRKYNDNREKKNNGLIDKLNLHREIHQNSKPITRHSNESQVRKRCTMKVTQNVGSINHQQSQKLLSTNIGDGIKTSLKCKDCETLKSNTNQGESKKNFNSNLQLEQKDDDYYVKILNQLIEKINKPKNVKSILFKDQAIHKSIEPTIFENRLVENPSINSSSSEEVVVKIEKIKGNRTVNNLEFSPENTFVNGNWARNKNIENKVNDFKPIENDPRSDSNNKNESISKYAIKQLNLKDSKNKVIETNDNISNKLKDLSEVTVQENKYVSQSTLPEENELLLFSKESIKPFIVSSTSKNKLDSSMIDDSSKLKFTTKEYSDQINKEDNALSYNENNKNQDKQFESTINNFPTMATIFKLNEELTSDLNEVSNLQNRDRIPESNADNPKTNYSDDDTNVEDSILDEKQNNSCNDNVNCKCNCNKKIMQNILNSAIMRNITDIKTDMYASPNSLKTNNHKHLNQLPKKNGDINKFKNTTNEDSLIKNKNDLNPDLLGKKQASYENTGKNNFKESNVNLLQGSMLNIGDHQSGGMEDNRTNENKEIHSDNSSFSSIIPELKLNKGQRKINKIENINKVEEMNNEKMSLIHKNIPQINTKQYVAKLKRFPQNDETSVGNNNMENNNMDRTTENNNIFTKSSAQMPNKIISRTPLKTIPEKSSKQIENITKKSPRELIEKMKYNIPINSRINTASHFDDYNNTNYMASTKKSPRILSQVPIKNIYNHSPQTIPRNLEKLMDNYDVNATKNSSKKLNPPSLVKTIERTKIKMTPTNIYSTKVPTYDKNRNTSTIKKVLKSKISKPALLDQNPKTLGSSDTTKQIKNNENIPILKFKNTKASSSVPLFSDKIAKTKNNLFDKPLTLNLKNKHVLNDQFPTKRVFTKKTDTKQNLKFKYDADSNVFLKSYPQKQSKVEDVYDHEHAPYTNDYLEPIVFGESMTKDNMSNNNSQFVIHSPVSRQTSNRNRKHNKSDVRLSQPMPINRSEQDENYIVTLKRSNKVDVNVKKHENQPDLNTPNNVPVNTDMMDNDKYDVSDPNDYTPNPNRFGLLSQVKITDGVFKIPLISQTSIDNHGSEYLSEIFVPIEKPDGRHSAISLTKLLTGEFKLSNEPGVENLSVIKPTPEMDSTLCSTRTSTDCESSVNTDYPVNPKPSKILRAIKDEKKLSSPIHIIQIINNGQCSNKHNSTVTVKNSVLGDDDHKIHKFRNECRRLSSIRSQNTPNNNGKINRKIENAYKHFDSAILDRFLQVYSPHLV